MARRVSLFKSEQMCYNKDIPNFEEVVSVDRIILHCDLNGFYASVELLSHPDLREVPMAVCGDPASRHGIILAKNEPAKRFGIQTSDTIWQDKK